MQSALLVLSTVLLLLQHSTSAETSADCSTCDHSLTAPLYQACSEEKAYLTFNDVKVECGQALSLETVGSIPKFHYEGAEPDELYTLLMVDTTGIDPNVGTQAPYLPFPLLHYGAVNIPGDAVANGVSLDTSYELETGARAFPFVSYQKPIPASQLTKEVFPGQETPPIETRAINYEFMLGKQRYKRENPNIDLLKNWEFIGFLKRNVADTTNIISTYFTTGYCVKDINDNEAADGSYGSDCPVPAKTLSTYGKPPAYLADAAATQTGAVSNGNVVDGIIPDTPSFGAPDAPGSDGTTDGDGNSASLKISIFATAMLCIVGTALGFVGV